ncbi:MAG: hypothetical protein M1819_003747 [Sarea resinae]|nr:MAG: hypothetical protein M1819_003747 [Sarea resinae]
MRPTRLLLVLLCLVAFPVILTISSLLFAHPQQQGSVSTTSRSKRGGISQAFSFHLPASLFPPSAIISLTDDNSTFFLARPAEFGPLLPSKGLSGQLWIGTGFGDDSLRRGGLATSAEGELGCSDVPGWSEDREQPVTDVDVKSSSRKSLAVPKKETTGERPRGGSTKGGRKRSINEAASDGLMDPPSKRDGTDDYLHHPLPRSEISKPSKPGQIAQHEANRGRGKLAGHADIQSLQEGAEIAGKVVLLSRGGCGFLEKVKWAQRRGAIAVIVGDDTRGGALVPMYAAGDTSNISIPSLFTSHTTAHLLSSLIPPGGYEEGKLDRIRKGDMIGVKGSVKQPSGRKSALNMDDRPTFTQRSSMAKPTSVSRHHTKPSAKAIDNLDREDSSSEDSDEESWLWSFFSSLGIDQGDGQGAGEDSRRPPSSGHLDWVPADEWSDEDVPEPPRGRMPTENDDAADKRKSKSASDERTNSHAETPGDGFVIGVQDWRDPDLVGPTTTSTVLQTTSTRINAKIQSTGHALKPSSKGKQSPPGQPAENGDRLKGGSITPGSGEYENPGGHTQDAPESHAEGDFQNDSELEDQAADDNDGWFSHLPWHDDDEGQAPGAGDPESVRQSQNAAGHGEEGRPNVKAKPGEKGNSPIDAHEGLWVTLTPTSMSTSPFFDTLLVLVVSPLVTLTVVYALLLLRSRIRRRRWRAPKAIVDRLPVRTYHTLSSSSSTSGSAVTTPNTSSPTSPLLQSSNRATISHTRPRSRTASSVSEQPSSLRMKDPATEREKITGGSTEWRRRYISRQVECVVCLEEYVDGQSRVMSLPCGHEFHAECITPWLTTRRRTCPICKGDVVRSLAHGSPSSNRYPDYHDSPNEDIQIRAAETMDESPSSAMPIPSSSNEDIDLERGDDSARTLVNGRSISLRGIWRGLASSLRSVTSAGEASSRPQSEAETDRDR